MNNETETKEEDFSEHNLVYVPHESLSRQVPAFPEGNAEYRHALGDHMINLMLQYRGVGLAANQINLNASVFVQKLQGEAIAMFNPEIIAVSGDKVLMTEGCLSDPGMYLKVKRPDMIEAAWEDENGNVQQTKLYGMDCRVFLHEFDHLQGVMFTDRVGSTKLKMARKKQQRTLQNFMV